MKVSVVLSALMAGGGFLLAFDAGSDDKSVISSYTLSWHDGAPPKDVINNLDFKKWIKGTLVESNAQLRYAKTSLISKGSSEIIIQEQVGGTGGYAFIAMTRQKTSWRELTADQAAFIFTNVPSRSHTLCLYDRLGPNTIG